MTRTEWAGVMALLTSYYPTRFKVDDPIVVQVWFEELSDLDVSDVIAGVRQMARSKADEWPSISTIRRYAQPEDHPKTVWAKALKDVMEFGPNGKWDSEQKVSRLPDFTPDVQQALARIGGARAILEAPDQQSLAFIGRDFCEFLAEERAKIERQALLRGRDPIVAIPAPRDGGLNSMDVISDLALKLKA